MIDVHCHLTPGIDDGARSMEEAVEMARIAAADGIEQMVSTPHMFNGFSKDPEPSEVLERIAALNEAIQSSPFIVAHYIERAVLIQITAMSVIGEFGAAARTCAETLLRHDCVDFLATDAHRPRQTTADPQQRS